MSKMHAFHCALLYVFGGTTIQRLACALSLSLSISLSLSLSLSRARALASALSVCLYASLSLSRSLSLSHTHTMCVCACVALLPTQHSTNARAHAHTPIRCWRAHTLPGPRHYPPAAGVRVTAARRCRTSRVHGIVDTWYSAARTHCTTPGCGTRTWPNMYTHATTTQSRKCLDTVGHAPNYGHRHLLNPTAQHPPLTLPIAPHFRTAIALSAPAHQVCWCHAARILKRVGGKGRVCAHSDAAH